MSASDPFARIVGSAALWVAPVGESAPDVNAAPSGNWTLLGPTDGDQTVSHEGALELLYDNDHQGPVKATRPQEGKLFTFSLVGLTLEHYARVLSALSNIVDAGGSPAVRTIGLKRGFIPTEYALLFKGASHSPYGDFPAMYVVPRGVFGAEPEVTYTKEGGNSAALDCEFVALEDDDTALAINRLGYLIAQTS